MTAALFPYGDTDSCDEFPFASTYESGAMQKDVNGNPKPYVTTGANCVQLTADHTATTGNNEPEDWYTDSELTTPTGTEPCVRAHNPNFLNGDVGSAYRSLIGTDRLIDKDPFWVAVTY